jgi:transposase InsO family protein
VLDDFSRYIVAWKLCANMRAEDVTATLDLALRSSGLDQATPADRPGCCPTTVRVMSLATWPSGLATATSSTCAVRPIIR